MVRHTTNAIAMPEETRRALVEGPWAPLLDAQGAVAVFFVLSGFVLAGSLARGMGRLALVQFWVKRVFRIQPPYMAALVVTWLASFAVLVPDGAAPFTNWLRWLASIHLAPGTLASHLVYPSSADGQLVVGWTLGVEMTWSLLLPLLVLVARKTHWAVALGLAAAPLGLMGMPLWLHYGVDFGLGIALWSERERIREGLAGLPSAVRVGLFVPALAMLCGPTWLGWHVPSRGILEPSVLDASAIALRAPGAALLIALTLGVSGWQKLLETRPALFLGRISYSLYLLHIGILLLCAQWLEPASATAGVALVGTVLALSIAASAGFHRLVERPSISLGNRICDVLATRTGGPSLRSTPPA